MQLFKKKSVPLPPRMNFGCGHDIRAGYLNVDSDPKSRADIHIDNCDISTLPKRYFSEIIAKDVLEHLPHAMLMPLLVDFGFLMKENGELFVQVPHIFHLIDMMRDNGTFEFQ